MTMIKTIAGLSALLALMACEPKAMGDKAMGHGDSMASGAMSGDKMMSNGG